MEEALKVPEAPQAPVEAPIILNPREAIENEVITLNNTFPESPSEKSTDSKPEDESPELTPESSELSEVDRIKKSVQKRIDKVVAKQKSAEEELAEARAEIARLKSAPSKLEVTPTTSPDNSDPTPEQVEAYIIKMREEGNTKEEIAATRYLIKLEKDAAVKDIRAEETKKQADSQARLQRENSALSELAKDYIVYDEKGNPDMKSDMTLANQKGKLFQVAIALYNDADLYKQYYSDADRASGFRKAVQDAKRELHTQGLLKTPKVEIETPRRERMALADPDAIEVEDTPQASNTLPTDAEKVRDEIKSRNSRMRNPRRAS